jgi:hypothetical protein
MHGFWEKHNVYYVMYIAMARVPLKDYLGSRNKWGILSDLNTRHILTPRIIWDNFSYRYIWNVLKISYGVPAPPNVYQILADHTASRQ